MRKSITSILIALVASFAFVGCDQTTNKNGTNAATDQISNDSNAGEDESAIKLAPRFDCVSYNIEKNQFTAHFGYNNTGSEVDIPVGEQNQFSGDEGNLGQPTTFAEGNSSAWPKSTFAVDFNEGETLTWELNGHTVDASADSDRCLYLVKLDALWQVEGSEHLPAFPTEMTDAFNIVAESDYGTAVCSYNDNLTLRCDYSRPDGSTVEGLPVGIDGTYVVTADNIPEAWEAIRGLGEALVGDACQDENSNLCQHFVRYQLDAESASIPKFNIDSLKEIVDDIKTSFFKNSFWGGFAGAAAGAVGALLVYKLVTYIYYRNRYPYDEGPIPGGGAIGGTNNGGVIVYPPNQTNPNPTPYHPYEPGVAPGTPPSGGYYDPNSPWWGYDNRPNGSNSPPQPGGTYQPGFDPYYPYGYPNTGNGGATNAFNPNGTQGNFPVIPAPRG